jgi:hypothetical protein
VVYLHYHHDKCHDSDFAADAVVEVVRNLRLVPAANIRMAGRRSHGAEGEDRAKKVQARAEMRPSSPLEAAVDLPDDLEEYLED